MTEAIKIIYVSSSEYPSKSANSVQVIKQSNGFSRQGYSVNVLARACYADSQTHDLIELKKSYGISSDVDLLLMEFRDLAGLLRSVLYPLWVAIKAYILTKEYNSILYGRHALGLLCAGFTCAPKALVYECHGPPQRIELMSLKLLVALRKLNRIVVISNALKNILIKNHPFLQRIDTVVAHDGCDTPFVTKEKENGLSIGYVGGFYERRGLNLIAELANRFPDLVFHIIGGEEREFVLCTGMSLPDNIICHGRVPPAELDRYYELFNVALAPYDINLGTATRINTVDYMSPLKIFEYMGHGKAVIASDLPVLHEVLEDGVNAILAEPGNVEDWHKAILRIQNPSLRKTLSVNAMEIALAKYTWDARAVNVLLGIFDEK